MRRFLIVGLKKTLVKEKHDMLYVPSNSVLLLKWCINMKTLLKHNPWVPLSPPEIRDRDFIAVNVRFTGEHKDFLADLLEESQDKLRIRVTLHDLMRMLVQQEIDRRGDAV